MIHYRQKNKNGNVIHNAYIGKSQGYHIMSEEYSLKKELDMLTSINRMIRNAVSTNNFIDIEEVLNICTLIRKESPEYAYRFVTQSLANCRQYEVKKAFAWWIYNTTDFDISYNVSDYVSGLSGIRTSQSYCDRDIAYNRSNVLSVWKEYFERRVNTIYMPPFPGSRHTIKLTQKLFYINK